MMVGNRFDSFASGSQWLRPFPQHWLASLRTAIYPRLIKRSASGFVHGAIRIVTPPTAASLRMRANAFIQGLRDAIDLRIRSVLSGDGRKMAC